MDARLPCMSWDMRSLNDNHKKKHSNEFLNVPQAVPFATLANPLMESMKTRSYRLASTPYVQWNRAVGYSLNSTAHCILHIATGHGGYDAIVCDCNNSHRVTLEQTSHLFVAVFRRFVRR